MARKKNINDFSNIDINKYGKLDFKKIKNLPVSQKMKILDLLEKRQQTLDRNILRWGKYYGENSIFPIDKYPKQKIFFEAGKYFKNRAISGGNRSSKSFSAIFEISCHATGEYPTWWKGYRFEKKNLTIVCTSDDFKTSREVVQSYLLKAEEGAEIGTGFLPYDTINFEESKKLTKDTYDYLMIRNNRGGHTKIIFKSSSQGADLFQGTRADLFFFDEEPPISVFAEAVMRTTTTNGLIIVAYTPLKGITEVVKMYADFEYNKFLFINEDDNIEFFEEFKDEDKRPSKFYIKIGWPDIPHLTEKQKRETLENVPEWQWEARMFGNPILGSGQIYGFKESDIVCEAFNVPEHWRKWYGLDVGRAGTTFSFFAEDPETKVNYVYKELCFYDNEGVAEYIDEAYKEVGEYQTGAIDTAAGMGAQHDKKISIRKLLTQGGFHLKNANKSVVEGLTLCWQGFKKGMLKIFDSCINHIKEIRIYRRDENGNIVKQKDHCMDSMRYGFMASEEIKNGLSTLISLSVKQSEEDLLESLIGNQIK